MKEKKNNRSSDSRRDFLNKGFFASAGWIAGMMDVPNVDKKVKMLTPDGKLVEVDESLIKNNKSRKQVGNKEILEWIDKGKSK